MGPDFITIAGGGNSLKLFNCNNTGDTGGFFLDAGGKWHEDMFCMAHDEKFLTDDPSSYEISVDMYNYQAWQGPGSGHLGLAFNMLDTDNYEAVFIR